MKRVSPQGDSIKSLRLARLLSLLAKAGARQDYERVAKITDVICTDYGCAVQLCMSSEGVYAELRST